MRILKHQAPESFIKIKLLRTVVIGGEIKKAGDEVEVHKLDAKSMIASERAVPVIEAAKSPDKEPSKAEETTAQAETQPKAETPADAPKPKRQRKAAPETQQVEPAAAHASESAVSTEVDESLKGLTPPA